MKNIPYERFSNYKVNFLSHAFVQEEADQFIREFTSDSEEVLCYTSGSTGIPKPLWIKKKRMLHSARRTATYFQLDESKNGLLCLPAKFIGGRMMLVRAMVSGMKIHSVKPVLNPLLEDLGCTIHFAAFTPAQVAEMLKEEVSRKRFSEIESVIIGGAALNPKLEQELTTFPNAIYVTYGMTETVSHIALRKVGETQYTLISPAISIGVNAKDCLWIQDENLSDEVIQTGDVVKLTSPNSFEWLGRVDFAINSGGLKIHPEQVEQKIRRLPGWIDRSFFIASVQNATFGERPVLIVEESPEGADEKDLKNVLDKYEMPDKIYEVPQFFYTSNGKLNRTETLKMALQLHSR